MVTKVFVNDGAHFRVCPDGDICEVVTYYGKSTDVKPTKGVKNADVFYEMDTNNAFLYDEEAGEWLPQ